MVGDVGYVIGPILLGLIADVTGPSSALLAGAGMMAVTVLIFAFLAPETWRGTKS